MKKNIVVFIVLLVLINFFSCKDTKVEEKKMDEINKVDNIIPETENAIPKDIDVKVTNDDKIEEI